jgi:hypothetical protein
VHGFRCKGVFSKTELRTALQVKFPCVSGQSDFDIYIIESLLKHIPTLATIAQLEMDLQAGEFPQIENSR